MVSGDNLICPYCGGRAFLQDSKVIYGVVSFGLVYTCQNYPACNTYVGVHHGTTIPLGTLAGPRLRALRRACHAAFDPFWETQPVSRSTAYTWLKNFMNFTDRDAHIGEFNEEECEDFLARFGEFVEAGNVIGDRGG